ncbi:MAG TPA: proline dehydrogenase family protein [Oligoflexia bacterium]|nr:proline dehydrogenase family protein [Oligoflexia bacterium]
MEEEIFNFGKELIDKMRQRSSSSFGFGNILSLRSAEDKVLAWAMKHERLKINLFRFVDVLPALGSSKDIVQHVHEYFYDATELIPLFKYALKVSPDSILSKSAAFITKKQIRSMSRRFIVGEDEKDALPYLKSLRKRGLAFTVDLLGEASVSEHESLEYLSRYKALIKTLKEKDNDWQTRFKLPASHPKDFSILNVSIKLTALYSQTKAVNFSQSVSILSERLKEILLNVKAAGGSAYIDMEDCASTDIILQVLKNVLTEPEFSDYPHFGMVLQAYLKRTPSDLESIKKWVIKRGTPIQVRLVKGAYWDTEVILAKQNGWPVPVFLKKEHSDSCFEYLSKVLLDAGPDIFYPAFASHNIRSIAHALVYARSIGIDSSNFEIQTLYGMGDEFKDGLTEQGYLVRDYAPVGELIPGMGYLVRRLLENTANEGFLRKTNFEKISLTELLKAPPDYELLVQDNKTMEAESISQLAEKNFQNLPFLDFTLEAERNLMKAAINDVKNKLKNAPFLVKPIIDDSVSFNTDDNHAVTVYLPENSSIPYSKTIESSVELAENAITNLHSSFHLYRDMDYEIRVDILRKASAIMTKNRYELAALVCLEAGKTWVEADADVAEAVDFCNYYADEAESLFKKRRMGNYQGEYNSYFYEPRGLTLVIGPWNFALAIPCGMFAASVVTGNVTILKPAEETPYIAYRMFQIFLEAGLPENAAAFLPGKGEIIGAYMAKDPRVSTINFTGSKAVGMELLKIGGDTKDGSDHIKRVIAEMGGKNAIVIDSDADLDEAVKGVLHSAFSFQGQKCSACSRVYVVSKEVYSRFRERISQAVESIKIGLASDPSSYMGPVITNEAKERINSYISRGKKEGSLLAKGNLPIELSDQGHYVAPHIFERIPEDSILLTEEIFGPVLVISEVSTFEEGIEKALSSHYRLTGAVYSRSPRNIDYAINNFRVGNLYINRGSTGALVFRQPFGGSHHSGVGAKAGGPDYLHQFVVPRTVTENTMRRGFAPQTR